jgi:hypothetical protein
VLKRVCEDEARPIREVNPEMPEWLERIVARLHTKRPDDRYQSADEVRDLLADCLASAQGAPVRIEVSPPPAPAAATSPRWRPGLGTKLLLGGVLLVLLAPCLLLGLMFGVLAYIMPPMPALPNSQVEEKPAPRALLGNGRTERGKDGRLRFSVDYEFHRSGPEVGVRYIWMVRSGDRVLLEETHEARNLPAEGTLEASRPEPRIAVRQPLESWLERERLVPGKLGWQRERISNVTKLAP